MIAPLATFFLMFLAFAGHPVPGGEVFRPISFDSALAAAKREQKIVLAVFVSPSSADSKRFESTIITESRMRDWIDKHAVAVRLEIEKRPDLVARYRVHVVPTIVFLMASGTEMDRLVGFHESKTFRAEGDAILAGSDALARAEKRLHGHENDPNVRIDYAGALYDRGLLAEASVEYLWCWDHGLENDPDFGALRIGFLLREIQRLGRVYTPAADALDERAQKIFPSVVDCSVDAHGIEDFTEIDRILNRDDRTLAAYDKLPLDEKPGDEKPGDEKPGNEKCGALRIALVPFLEPALVDAKRYKEVADLLGDALPKLEARIAAYVEESKRIEKDKTIDADAILTPILRQMRAEIALHYEAMLGGGRSDDGDKLAQRFITLDPHGDSYVAMIRAAIRAGLHGHALGLVKRSTDEPKLTDAERLQIKRASAEIVRPK